MKIKQAIFMVKRNRMKFLGVVAFDAEKTTAAKAAKDAWGLDSAYEVLSPWESWKLNENLPVVVYPGE